MSKTAKYQVKINTHFFFNVDGVDKALVPGKIIELPEDNEYVRSIEAQGMIKKIESPEVEQQKEAIKEDLREQIKNSLAEVGVTPNDEDIEAYLTMNVVEFSQVLEGLKAKSTEKGTVDLFAATTTVDYSKMNMDELAGKASSIGADLTGLKKKVEYIGAIEKREKFLELSARAVELNIDIAELSSNEDIQAAIDLAEGK